jgi:hypothetical protein
LPEDNGERFLSEYHFSQKRRNERGHSSNKDKMCSCDNFRRGDITMTTTQPAEIEMDKTNVQDARIPIVTTTPIEAPELLVPIAPMIGRLALQRFQWSELVKSITRQASNSSLTSTGNSSRLTTSGAESCSDSSSVESEDEHLFGSKSHADWKDLNDLNRLYQHMPPEWKECLQEKPKSRRNPQNSSYKMPTQGPLSYSTRMT